MIDKEELPPIVFISYSHDGVEHSGWVLNLASQLRSNGVDVIFDGFETKIGSDLALFMEQGLNASHKVICICSDKYNEKANKGIAGVGYEKMIMASEYLKDTSIEWIMPVIRNCYNENRTPVFLRTKKYIDFMDDDSYEQKYYELLRDIHDSNIKPPIGKNPFKYGGNVLDIIAGERLVKTALHIDRRNEANAKFNIRSNNGEYIIGFDDFTFRTNWSQRDADSVYAYANVGFISSIACVQGDVEIELIDELRNYDFSNRERVVHIKDSLIWINQKGKILITKLNNVTIRNDNDIEILIEYKILEMIWPQA